jgi:hypothetical protein
MLCQLCCRVLDIAPRPTIEWKYTGDDKIEHHRSLDSLLDSIARGCQLCHVGWAALQKKDPRLEQSTVDLFELACEFDVSATLELYVIFQFEWHTLGDEMLYGSVKFTLGGSSKITFDASNRIRLTNQGGIARHHLLSILTPGLLRLGSSFRNAHAYAPSNILSVVQKVSQPGSRPDCWILRLKTSLLACD